MSEFDESNESEPVVIEQVRGTRTMLKVSGYLNGANTKRHIIPKVIVDMTILFLQQPHDRFVKARDEIEFWQCDCVAIIGNYKAIPKWSSIFGELEINCNNTAIKDYQWKFNIQCERVSIGIIPTTIRWCLMHMIRH